MSEKPEAAQPASESSGLVVRGCYPMVLGLPDRDMVERYFDDDGMVVVGWPDTKEELVSIGSNTELNRQLGDFIAEAIGKLHTNH